MTQISPLLATASGTNTTTTTTENSGGDFAAVLDQALAVAETAAESPAAAAEADQEADFTKLMTESLLNGLTENALSGLGGSAPNLAADAQLEGAFLSAAANGEMGKNEVALFLMMLMLKECGNGGAMAPLVGAMSSLLSPNEDGSYVELPNSSASRYTTLATPDNSSFLPSQAWLPSALRRISLEDTRSAQELRQVIDQFQVETAERYRPYKRGGDTYCNIFVWDVTRALGCEIPHYVDRTTGEPRSYPNTSGAYEMGANATHDWLLKHGSTYGWQEVTATEAQAWANAGGPAVTAWKNTSGGAGHVQIVCPSKNGSYDTVRGVTVAQAGSKCTSYDYLSNTVGREKRSAVRYFIHA